LFDSASRMESSGIRDRIQISSATADFLFAAGKKHWVQARKDCIEAKGKGILQTFWVTNVRKSENSSNKEGSICTSDTMSDAGSDIAIGGDDSAKRGRLVDWMVELLSGHVRKLVRT
jgi:Adenylate and Guanylate cyclase catalytic domain